MSSDKEWGGDKADRQSTNGAAMMCVEQRGDECAMAAASQKTKWAITVATELGVHLAAEALMLKADSERGQSCVPERAGGRCDEEVRTMKMAIQTVATVEKSADLMTTCLGKAEVADRLRRVSSNLKERAKKDVC